MSGKYIIIEGNIGAGKSSLAQELCAVIGAEYLPEPADGKGRDNNPFLKPYYEDPKRWGYTMQVHLLSARYRAHQYAQAAALYRGGTYIGDRSYFGDCCFANMLHADGLMSNDEYESYLRLHKSMQAQLLYPSVAIFLDVKPEVCNERISKRMSERAGRKCESAIDLDYLRKLQTEIDKLKVSLGQSGSRIITLDWSDDKSPAELFHAATDIKNEIEAMNLDLAFPAWCGIAGAGL